MGMDPDTKRAWIGAYGIDAKTQEVFLDQNSELSLMPASCLKVVTTAAALHLLGPDFRFQTHLAYDGHIQDKTYLQGNLWIQGEGDPCLGSDRCTGSLSWDQQIALWADQIQALGIQKIEGKIVADASRWETALAVPSWAWEDLGNYYGAGASALSFHENAYTLFFQAGAKVSDPTTLVRIDPPLPLAHFHNEVLTSPPDSGDRACIYSSEYSSIHFVRGTIPQGTAPFSIQGAIPSPSTYCASLLQEELLNRGIVVQEAVLTPTEKTPFYTTFSPPVSEIVYWTNQKSLNLYAEHLLKKMGEVALREGSTKAGIQAVTQFWKSQGIDLDGFNMADGSGLSRKNLVTAKQMVAVLQFMKNSPHFACFFASLKEEEADIRSKGGSMSFVRGCVGYQKEKIFAILINHCRDGEQAKAKIDAILSSLPCSKTPL